MTTEKAQLAAVMAQPKTIHGVKVWPVTQGHIIWLRETRKNKILNGKEEDDFAMAEICFAFTQDPLPLQRITGQVAAKRINELLIASPVSTLRALFTYAAEQLDIYIKTLVSPKKLPAQASRKPAARARKR
mgnify:CR=1 FL=1